MHTGRVFVKICSFWACLFGFATLIFYLIFLLIFFVLLKFPANAFGLLFRLNYLCMFVLFFKFTCLFLQNNLESLLLANSWDERYRLLCEWSIEGRKIGLCFIPQNQCLKCHRHWWLEQKFHCSFLALFVFWSMYSSLVTGVQDGNWAIALEVRVSHKIRITMREWSACRLLFSLHYSKILLHRPSCRRLCYMWVCFRWKTPGDGNQAPQLYCKQEDH